MTSRISFIFACLCLGTFLLPSVHDYALYLEQWHHILKGKDPWVNTLNAYGPVYSFMAGLAGIHDRLPAVMFLGIYTSGIWFLLKRQLLIPDLQGLIFLALNPLFICFGWAYSTNDVLLAGLILLFLGLMHLKNYLWAGAVLGLAISFKFSVIFLIPILFLQEKTWRPSSLISMVLVIILAYGAAFLVWGDTFKIPFLYGAERESRLLSVFRFIRGQFQPLGFAGITNLDSLNTLILGTGVLLSFGLLYRFRIENVFLQAIALLTAVFSLYKVGNHQYFLTVFPLLSIINQLSDKRPVQMAGWLLLVWYSLASLLYHFTRQEFPWGYSGIYHGIREWIGLPTFLVQLYFLISLFRYGGQTERI